MFCLAFLVWIGGFCSISEEKKAVRCHRIPNALATVDTAKDESVEFLLN